MKNLKTAVLLLLVLTISDALAISFRDRDNKQIEIFASSGWSSYRFQPYIPNENALGLSSGVSFSVFANNNLGFSTGLIYSHYQWSAMLDGLSFSSPSVDSEGDNFKLISTFSNFNEESKSQFIQVPLSLKYRHYFTKSWGIMPEIGILIHSSLATKSTTNGRFTTVAEYPQFGEYTLIDGIPGSGTYEPSINEKNYNWNLGVSAMTNLNIFFVLRKHLLLTSGLTLDYQINPNKGDKNTTLVEYEVTSYKTATCHYHPILSTVDAGHFRKGFIGLKIGLVYKWY